MTQLSKDQVNELLARLAPEQPISQDEQGGCVFCGGTPPGLRYGYAGRYLSDHDADCPWVAAREAIGDQIPERRDSSHE